MSRVFFSVITFLFLSACGGGGGGGGGDGSRGGLVFRGSDASLLLTPLLLFRRMLRLHRHELLG